MVPSSGKAYLLGGRESQDVDIFDPATSTWSKGETAPALLHHMQCVEIGGKIYLPAAWTNWYPQEDNADVMHVYNTMTDKWEQETAMPERRRRGSAAIVVDGTKLWVSHGNRGGHETGSFATSYGWIDYYDTTTKTWVMGDTAGFPDAPNPRDHTGGGLINGRICVTGGRNGGEVNWPPVSPTDCFNPATKTWTVEANIPTDRSGSSYGISCDGRLMVAGGERDLTNRVDVFDGTTWESFDNGLNQARHGSGLAVDCEQNLIYIASGSPNGGGGNTNSMEIYYPNEVPTTLPPNACGLPEFVGDWEGVKTAAGVDLNYPMPVAEAQGAVVGDHFLIVSGFNDDDGGYSAATLQNYARDLSIADAPWVAVDDLPTDWGITHGGFVVVENVYYQCGGYQGGHPGR